MCVWEKEAFKNHPENNQTEQETKKETELYKQICPSWGDRLSTKYNNAYNNNAMWTI